MAEPVSTADKSAPDQIWNFRGYHLSPAEFNTAMVHFYRGEVTRSNTWRMRLDATTNWAVVATGAALSFTFSAPEHSHIMIPINSLLITLFLYIEARRYRYYELWAYRVRLMETDFFAAMLAPPFTPSETWATYLVDNLLHPSFTITFWEASGRRFRRNYQFIYVLLIVAWAVKVALHPDAAQTAGEFVRNAAVGPIPGHIAILFGGVFNLILFGVGWMSAGLHEGQGEILRDMRYGSPLEMFRTATDVVGGHRLFSGRNEQLAHIITSPEAGRLIAERITSTMARGVTAMEGHGVYSGEPREILMVAIHPQQAMDLKRLVREIDSKAFVIIHRAEEVIGRGFRGPS